MPLFFGRGKERSSGSNRPSGRRRRGWSIEPLEVRQLLTAAPWQNPGEVRDVNNDTYIAADDALRIINRINSGIDDKLPDLAEGETPSSFYDCDGDGYATATDALMVINWLNSTSQAPTLAAIPDVTLVAGAPFNIALDGFDADGDTLSYAASPSNSAISASIAAFNESLRLTMAGFGVMEFELFNDLTPETVAHIKAYVEAGNYDGLTFHRIIPGFMIQGGDPAGNGTGNMGGQVDDEFDTRLRFTSKGILAMANAGDDTGDSQFFITAGPTRHLDIDHTIFGFLTKGESVREAVAGVPRKNEVEPNHPLYSQPVTPPVIESAEIFRDVENGVLRLSAPIGTAGTYTVTVQVSDGRGGTASRTFNVNVVADDVENNARPYLPAIDDINMTVGQTVNRPLTAIDAEGDSVSFWGYQTPAGIDFNYGVDEQSEPLKYLVVPSTNGTATAPLTVTATTPGTKTLEFIVLKPTADHGKPASFDTQSVTVNVAPDAPTAIDLLSASDDGASNSDNVTTRNNASAGQALTFKVSGVWQGATVTLKAGDQVIGTATAPAAANGAAPVMVDLEITTNGNAALESVKNSVVAVQSFAGLASVASSPLDVFISDQLPPVLNPIGNRTLAAGATLVLTAAATHPDPLRHMQYFLAPGAPSEMLIDDDSGGLIWHTTAANASNAYTITIIARSSDGLEDSETIQITVTA